MLCEYNLKGGRPQFGLKVEYFKPKSVTPKALNNSAQGNTLGK
jgi:hypothetical protein